MSLTDAVIIARERDQNHYKKKEESVSFPSLSCHSSTFFSTAATCLGALLAVVNIMMFTFLGASITDIRAQITKLLCKLAVH